MHWHVSWRVHDKLIQNSRRFENLYLLRGKLLSPLPTMKKKRLCSVQNVGNRLFGLSDNLYAVSNDMLIVKVSDK